MKYLLLFDQNCSLCVLSAKVLSGFVKGSSVDIISIENFLSLYGNTLGGNSLLSNALQGQNTLNGKNTLQERNILKEENSYAEGTALLQEELHQEIHLVEIDTLSDTGIDKENNEKSDTEDKYRLGNVFRGAAAMQKLGELLPQIKPHSWRIKKLLAKTALVKSYYLMKSIKKKCFKCKV